MLKLILGRAGSGKTTAVYRRMCGAGAERPQVLLVPEQNSHEAERALCKVGGNGVSLYAEVLSFSRLANRVFLAAGGLGEAELDAGGRLLLMHRAVKSVAAQLTVCARSAGRASFLRSLIATVDELKSCRVSPADLERAGCEAEGPEGEKLRDLSLICGAYDALTAQVALDPRDRLTRTAEKLKDCPWAAGRDLWLDGFTDFTPQQIEVLSRLLEQAHSVTVTLTCDHLEEDEGGTGIFSPARRTAAQLLRAARERRVPSQVEHLAAEGGGRAADLDFLEKALFAHAPGLEREPEGAVELFAARTPRGEVEWTAARILELVRREGLRFRDIGVVARSYRTYQDLVESVFARYGVPVFSSSMSEILDKPILALVTGALDTVAGGYVYDDVFRYLKTGLTDLGEEDRDLLENYVLKWDIRGSRWTQEKPWTMHPRGYGFPMAEEDQALLERVDRARRQVAAPLERLRKNSARTGRGQAMALYGFLEEIGLPRAAGRAGGGTAPAGGARAGRGVPPALGDPVRRPGAVCRPHLGGRPHGAGRVLQLCSSWCSPSTTWAPSRVSLDRVTAGETTRQTGHRVQGALPAGGGRQLHPPGGAGARPALRRRPHPAGLLRPGAEPERGGAPLPGDDHRRIRPAPCPAGRLIRHLARPGGGGEERRPCLPGGAAEAAVPRPCRGRGRSGLDGAPSGMAAPLPALELAGRSPAGRRGPAGPCRSTPPWWSGWNRPPDAGTRGSLSRAAVDRPLRQPGAHVRLPDGQIQVLPLLLLHAATA